MERIKSRIENLIKEWRWRSSTEAKYRCEAYCELLDFINSLQEEHVSNDLDEAANNYVGHAPEIDEDLSCFTKRNAFIAGAKWGMEQAEVKIQAQSIAVAHGCPKESLSNNLEEAAENYPSIIRTISPQWEAEVESAFIAGAKWQKKQTIEKICIWLEDNVDHYAYNKDFVPNAKERFIKMFRRAEI